MKARIALLTWHSLSWNECKLKFFRKVRRLVQLTKVTLASSFLQSAVLFIYFSSQLPLKLKQSCGNHVFHLLKRLCLTLSNVICGFRGYLHGKEARIVNLPVGCISCPSSYLICMPLLDQQQQLNCQLILLPNEIVKNCGLTSGLSTSIGAIQWPIFYCVHQPHRGVSLYSLYTSDWSSFTWRFYTWGWLLTSQQ